jgi:tetratricopeptide (TPR) repeat protein
VAGYLSEQESAYQEAAIGYYQAALEQVDQLPVDHANLGCLLWDADRPLAALQEMGLAHHLQPGHLLYRLNLGHYLESTGDGVAAVDQYAQILAIRPDYVQSSYWGQTEWRTTARPHIIEAAAQILATSNRTEDKVKLVDLYLHAGDLEAARQVWETALAQGSADPYSRRLSQGNVLLAEERLAEAREAAQAAVQARPAAGDGYLLLTKIALAQGDLKGAVQTIEAALFLSPTPEVIYQAGRVAAGNGETFRAVQYYEQAFDLSTNRLDLNLTRYATEVARRRPLPVSYLPCLRRIYPSQRLITLTQAEGKHLEAEGDYRKAAQVYHRLLTYEPNAPEVEARLEALCREQAEVCDFRAN